MMKQCLQAIAFVAVVISLWGCDRGREIPDEVPAENGQLSSAELIIERNPALAPGGELRGEIVLTMAPGWHTYSDPPGDSGMPPIINFAIPPDWEAVLEPLPPAERFEDESGVTFGYENELRIGFHLRAARDATPGAEVEMTIDVQWLICKDICLPESTVLKEIVTVVQET